MDADGLRPPARGRSEHGEADELLSVAEAALRYGLPEWKVTRLLRENQLDGARKIRGQHGPVWRIPAAALEAQGFAQQLPTSGESVTLELSDLRRTLQSLTGTLRIERQRLANKQAELEDIMLEVGRLRRELGYERTRRQDAEAQVARLQAAAVDLVAVEQAKDPGERVIDQTGIDRFALEAERWQREGGG